MNQLEWRRNNINSLISGVYSCIKAQSSDTVLGFLRRAILKTTSTSAPTCTRGEVSAVTATTCARRYISARATRLCHTANVPTIGGSL